MSFRALSFSWPLWPAPRRAVRRRRFAVAQSRAASGDPFVRDMRGAAGTAFRVAGVDEERVAFTLDVASWASAEERALCCQVVQSLVGDALARSLDPASAGRIAVALDRVDGGLRLRIEDDGWQPRSSRDWLEDNRAVRLVVRALGGSVRREVGWAFNRVTVQFRD